MIIETRKGIAILAFMPINGDNIIPSIYSIIQHIQYNIITNLSCYSVIQHI